MKIGIDARFVGPQGTGLGKYTEKLILNLQKIDTINDYAIFLRKNNWEYLKLNKNFKKVLADIHWYSLEEQIKMPKIFNLENLDLLHVPHFNVPFFYNPPSLRLGNFSGLRERSEFRKKFIVTVHDLIHHHFKETSATTRNEIVFGLKRIGYQLIINRAIQKSEKILVPSNFVKGEIIKYFKVPSQKIVVTYEAAEEEYFNKQQTAISNQNPILLYVGNAYPHKNLKPLLDALVILKKVRLILVCPRDSFADLLKDEIAKRKLEKLVELKPYLKAKELSGVFSKATAYVFPSLSEGFGIPGLNAMAVGIPVICSNIPTLKEIYGEAALYFDPENPKDIALKLQKVLSGAKTRRDLVEKGKIQVQKYSWKKMAEETLKVYESSK